LLKLGRAQKQMRSHGKKHAHVPSPQSAALTAPHLKETLALLEAPLDWPAQRILRGSAAADPSACRTLPRIPSAAAADSAAIGGSSGFSRGEASLVPSTRALKETPSPPSSPPRNKNAFRQPKPAVQGAIASESGSNACPDRIKTAFEGFVGKAQGDLDFLPQTPDHLGCGAFPSVRHSPPKTAPLGEKRPDCKSAAIVTPLRGKSHCLALVRFPESAAALPFGPAKIFPFFGHPLPSADRMQQRPPAKFS
jgi:hypothetical protein